MERTLVALVAVLAALLVGAAAWLAVGTSAAAPEPGPELAAPGAPSGAGRAALALPVPRAGRPERIDLAPADAGPPAPADAGGAGTSLTGIVRDRETLRPLAGVVVAPLGRTDGAPTDADGRYRLELPDVPFAAVVARHPDYVTEPKTWKRSQHGGRLDFALRHGVQITLTIVDRDTGAALPGAELREDEDGQAIASADASGTLALRVLPGREAGFVLAHEGHASLWWLWDGAGASDGLRACVPLLRPAQVEALVVDGAGRPLDGARVGVEKPDGLHFRLSRELLDGFGLPGSARDVEPELRGQADADGVHRLRLVPWPTPYRVTARLDGYVRATSEPIVLARADERARVTLRLADAGRVQGRVLRNDLPMSDAVVRCLGPSGESLGSAITNALGEYLVADVAPGRVHVELRDPRTQRLLHREVAVEAGRTTICDLFARVAFLPLGGRVTWSTGRPAAEVFVSVGGSGPDRFSARARTDADGRWRVEQVPDDVTFDVSASTTTTASLRDVRAGRLDVDLVLAAEGTLRLRLVDASSGDATVEPPRGGGWLRWCPSGETMLRHAVPDPAADGTFALRLPLGAVDLEVDLREHGFLPLALRGVPVFEGGESSVVRVPLERGGDVRLRFVDARGTPRAPPRHLVFALPESDAEAVREATPDESGVSTYRFDGRTVRVHFDDPARARDKLAIGADGGATLPGLAPGRWVLVPVPADLVLDPAAFLVPRDTGAPLAVTFDAAPPR